MHGSVSVVNLALVIFLAILYFQSKPESRTYSAVKIGHTDYLASLFPDCIIMFTVITILFAC